MVQTDINNCINHNHAENINKSSKHLCVYSTLCSCKQSVIHQNYDNNDDSRSSSCTSLTRPAGSVDASGT